MSIHGASGPAGQPLVNQALEPAWVRRGSAATQKAYESALSFEETLVEQLSQSLTATSGLDGESPQEGAEEGSSSANHGELSSLLPQALTGGIMKAGGLGLAAQLTRELPGGQSVPRAHATGGTAPAVSTVGGEAAPSGRDAGRTGGTAA
jgi:hypothetical protein